MKNLKRNKYLLFILWPLCLFIILSSLTILIAGQNLDIRTWDAPFVELFLKIGILWIGFGLITSTNIWYSKH